MEGMAGNGGLGNYPSAEIRMAYIDWSVPGTSVKVRLGRQDLQLPAVALNKKPAIWSSDPSDGITMRADIADRLSFAAFWARYDRQKAAQGDEFSTHHATTADVFAISPL